MRPELTTIAMAVALTLQVAGQTPAPPATVTVTGRVVDPAGNPLADVAVSLGGQKLKAPQTVVTAADGVYRFINVADGPYTVSFRRAGFKPLDWPNMIVASGERMTVVDVGPSKPGPMAVTLAPGRIEERAPAVTDGVLVRVQTSFGDIDIVVDTKRAPVTAANFLKYVDAGLYDGGRFHRATRPDNYNTAPPNRPMMEIIQGGANPEKKGQGFPPIPLERTSITGLKHVRGIVSMARGGPDTATSDFFILLDDQPSLDFGGKRFDDNQGAAAFGAVRAGLEVVTRIQQEPVQAQNLTPPVTIVSIKRVR